MDSSLLRSALQRLYQQHVGRGHSHDSFFRGCIELNDPGDNFCTLATAQLCVSGVGPDAGPPAAHGLMAPGIILEPKKGARGKLVDGGHSRGP